MMRQLKLDHAYLFLAIGIVSRNSRFVDAYDWACNLFCYNNGICRHGHGKFGAYAGIDPTEQLPFEQELHDNGMYCTCPQGYTGLQCEIKYVTCGRDDHTCFNGSACVKEHASNDGKIFYRCECDREESVMTAAYAGKYCEHISTVFCEGGNDGFKHSTSFCTNGGKCRNLDPDSDGKHGGCDCPEEWEGQHCETRSAASLSITKGIVHRVEDAVTANDIVWIVIGCIIAIFVLIYFRRYHYIKQQEKLKNRRGRRNQEMRALSRNDAREII